MQGVNQLDQCQQGIRGCTAILARVDGATQRLNVDLHIGATAQCCAQAGLTDLIVA